MAKISRKMIAEQIFDELDNNINLSKKDIENLIIKLCDKVVENVKNGNQVSFLRFGTFESKTIKAREVINPRTHQPMKVSAMKTIKFKPSEKIKELI